jgi:predicted nucleic acid-binding protein
LTRYLLDTNIISNVIKPLPSEPLLAWMTEQTDESLFIASLTLAEIRRGILEKPAGRKRKELEEWFRGAKGPQALFRGRILPFDENAALIWSELMAAGNTAGQPRSSLDMVLAAIAQSNDCILVTDNERHFPGVNLLNPLRGIRTAT